MKTLLVLMICIASFTATAQISGKVANEKGLPISGAIIRIYTNTQLKKTMLTDTAGYFYAGITSIDQLIVSAMGYRSDTIYTTKQAIGIIRLSMQAQQLNEILIQGKQAMIRQETDRSIISVNEQLKKLASNGLEIINLAPGISISDNEDAILMSGKSDVQIMINDKVVKMSTRDLAKLLKSMPANSIKQVEFLNNPPSKYEVNGNTGIINIKTNMVVKGITGNVDMSTSQGINNWADLSGLTNYGTGQLAISGYLAWHRGAYQTKNIKLRQLSSGLLNQQSMNLDRWNDPVFRIAIDYSLNTKHSLGGIIEREASTNTGSYNTDTQQDANRYLTSSQNPNTRHWNTYNLNYRYSDTLGTELTADLDRADFRKNSAINLLTTGQAPITYFNLTNIHISTFKADYTHNWKNKLKMEAGLKIAQVITNNSQDANLFHYQEQIRSVYSSLSKTYPKWGWQLGLRVEQTEAKGENGILTQPDTSYLNLLPSAYLNWTPSANHHFRLSLSHRIKRPDYGDLQPFIYVLDPLNQQAGNPSLRVERNAQAELSYTFNDRLVLMGTYTKTEDYFGQVYRQTGNTLIEVPENTGRKQTLNFDLNYPLKINKWWNMLYKINVGNDQFNGMLFQGQLDQNKWRYQFSTNQRFNLPGKYLLQLNGRFTSATKNLIYNQLSSANMSASISKKFFKEQASLRLQISDIFKTQRNYTHVNFGSLNYTDQGTFESQRIGLNFSWRFGNTKVKQTAERDRGDIDEKERSGN